MASTFVLIGLEITSMVRTPMVPEFCALIELYLTRLEIALFKFQGLHFSPPYGELYRTSCPFA